MADGGVAERLLKRDRTVVLAAIVGIVAIAALYTVLGIGMPMSAIEMTAMAGAGPGEGSMTMDGGGMAMMAMPAAWSFGYAVLVFLMWWVMMVAMMLPSAAPTVLLYSVLVRRTAEAAAAAPLAMAFMAGYLAVWAGFSLAATGLQWMLELHGLVSPAMMTLTSSVIGGCVLLAASAYQLSALKRVCLEHCRSPMQFLVERRRPGLSGAFRMGVEHGAFCLGCCWFLMALLFVGGIMNLYWIAGLAVLVALEKLAPVGGRLATLSAVALAVAGIWMISQALV